MSIHAPRRWHAVLHRPLILVAVAVGLVATAPVVAGKTYRWVDEQGNVHYSDSMPPEASRGERDVIGSDGHRREDPASRSEGSADASKESSPEAQRQARHDRMLLQTFTTLEDLQRTRDRRVGAVEARIDVVRSQVEEARAAVDERREHLESLPDDIAADAPAREMARKRLERAEDRLARRRDHLKRLQAKRDELAERFREDIARYRELKEARAER